MAKAKNSKSTKASGKSEAGLADKGGPSFEQALEKLETLVESMESDQAPLDQLIENYEKGTQLYGLCQQRLEDAQQRVDLIRNGAGMKKDLETFDEESGATERNVNLQTNTQTDDGELF